MRLTIPPSRHGAYKVFGRVVSIETAMDIFHVILAVGLISSLVYISRHERDKD